MNAGTERLIKDLVCDLVQNGITVRFAAEKTVSYESVKKKKITCCGWFDEIELACATKQPEEYWVQTFCHEYIHFLQFKEKSEHAINENDILFDKFLCNMRVSKSKLDIAIDKLQKTELDCERRSVQLLKKYKTGFNFKRITQRANAYIYFYSVAKDLKSWYVSSPSLIKEIIDMMPSKFLRIQQYKKVSPEVFNLYKNLSLKKDKQNEFS